MHPAIRTKNDGLGDIYSLETGVDFSEGDVARQEFKADVDINVQLARFGVFAPQRVSQWGQEIDYGVDLQTALEAVAAAKRAHNQLSAELRAKYGTWQSLLNALESGEFKMDVNPPKSVPPEGAPAPVAGAST